MSRYMNLFMTSLIFRIPQLIGVYLVTGGIELINRGYYIIDTRNHPGPYPNSPTIFLFLLGIPLAVAPLIMPYFLKVQEVPNITLKERLAWIFTDLIFVALTASIILYFDIDSMKLFWYDYK